MSLYARSGGATYAQYAVATSPAPPSSTGTKAVYVHNIVGNVSHASLISSYQS